MEQSKIEKADKKACKLIDRELSIEMDTLFLTLEADSDSYADDLKCFKRGRRNQFITVKWR